VIMATKYCNAKQISQRFPTHDARSPQPTVIQHITKRPISQCKIARMALQNDPFRLAKQAVLIHHYSYSALKTAYSSNNILAISATDVRVTILQ
jgi:hypothetical protein